MLYFVVAAAVQTKPTGAPWEGVCYWCCQTISVAVTQTTCQSLSLHVYESHKSAKGAWIHGQ